MLHEWYLTLYEDSPSVVHIDGMLQSDTFIAAYSKLYLIRVPGPDGRPRFGELV